jgi:hypothetical protein
MMNRNTMTLADNTTLAGCVKELLDAGCDRKLMLGIGLEIAHDMYRDYMTDMLNSSIDGYTPILSKTETEMVDENYEAYMMGYSLYNDIHCDISPVTANNLFTPEELREFDAMLEAEEESYPFDELNDEWFNSGLQDEYESELEYLHS